MTQNALKNGSKNMLSRVRIWKFLLEVYEGVFKIFPKPVDKSPLNVLTSRGIFFWFRWKLLFEIPNIVRDIQNLDEQVMYLYNGGTTEYQCSTISRCHPTRYRYTGSTELLHHAFGSVGGSCRKQNPTLNFQSRLHRTSLWSESHAPADFWCSV